MHDIFLVCDYLQKPGNTNGGLEDHLGHYYSNPEGGTQGQNSGHCSRNGEERRDMRVAKWVEYVEVYCWLDVAFERKARFAVSVTEQMDESATQKDEKCESTQSMRPIMGLFWIR